MRIIAGSLKGKKLHPIKGTTIRPTADRLRESIFNILSFHVRDAVVLDLFAGTGALGIEALSRVASFAVFLDKYKNSISIIKQNIRSCALENRTNVIQWDIEKNLNCIRSAPTPFNLVFMDPPYNKNLVKPTLRNLHIAHALEKDALIVAEHSDSETIPEDCPGYTIAEQRRYGKTLVSFLNYMV
ncbi:16S rRNA (guanine(966)-N(2))-methyltransferase RsmD [Desulfococcaceae bacterium HSG8]|nr:16S rRNA (guanine(966)-N(2))-methyltransferase RsmD [Desulfococcaceae bacterium HSG8]